MVVGIEHGLVQVNGPTIPVAHPYPQIPSLPPPHCSHWQQCFLSHLQTIMCQSCYTVEALPTNTLISRQLFLRLPSQNPVFLDSQTNALFFHSCKWPAPVTNTFFASQGCLLTRASTVLSLKIIVSFLFATLTKS